MKEIYLPDIARIDKIVEETGDVKTYTIRFKDKNVQKQFDYKPGQFVELSVFGVGEIPISITSTPTRTGFIELSIKDVGAVSGAIHKLLLKSEIGIRGPYGNGFLYQELNHKNLVFVGGGIGLAPLRSLINYVLDNRSSYGDISILYGSRTPSDLVFKDEIKKWEERKDIEALITVDREDSSWKGNVGVVTTLFEKSRMSKENCVAFVCGPPIMIPFVIKDLLKLGFTEDTIISTLERHMKCGVGKCGHCCIGDKYICVDGPVFTYREMKTMEEA